MVGHLKQINPEIDGLTGNETNPIDPTDPNSRTIKTRFDGTDVTSFFPLLFLNLILKLSDSSKRSTSW